MQVIYHGHSFIEIEREGTSILIDPFISGNPRCDITLEQVLQKNITHIIVTCELPEYIGQTLQIAQEIGSTVIAISSICDFLQSQWIDRSKLISIEIWSSCESDDITILMIQAQNNSLDVDTIGVVVDVNGARIYHAWAIQSLQNIDWLEDILDLAFLPIGGKDTMNSDQALYVASQIKAKTIVPINYNTWSSNKADDMYFAQQIMLKQYAVPKVLRAGQYIVL